MINSIIFLLISLFAFIGPLSAAINEYKVVGYYPNWGIYRSPSFKPSDINYDLITHINYAFAKVDNLGNIQLFDSWADVENRSDWTKEKPYWGNFRQLTEIKQKYPHVKTLISIGGWTLSDTFSALAENPNARINFAKNAVNFCKQYGFDGVDIDWEYPGFAEHSGRPQDKKNFTLLLKELHLVMKAETPTLLVTIAAPAGPTHYNNMEVNQIHPYLDWINLMSYDLHGPWGDADNKITNHHSPLYPSAEGHPDLTIYSAVQFYLEQGVPAKKLVLGMPFYGRVFANSSGLHSSYNGAGSGTTQEPGMRFFYDIKQNLLNSYHYYWDERAQVPYLYNPKNREFVTFDDEESLRRKALFIKQLGLGGAMVWELGLDTRPSWDALHAIVNELRSD